MKSNAQQLGIVDDDFGRVEQTAKRIEENAGSLSDGFAILISGFPGAGKTTAARAMKETLEKEAESDVLHINLDKLAAIESVDRLETEMFLTAVTRQCNLEEQEIAIFDGVQQLEEFEYLAKFFQRLGLVYILSHHAERHTRLIKDARSNEETPLEEVSHDALRFRDMEAGEAGLDAIEETRFSDVEILNESLEKSEFEQYAKYVSQDLYLEFIHNDR